MVFLETFGRFSIWGMAGTGLALALEKYYLEQAIVLFLFISGFIWIFLPIIRWLIEGNYDNTDTGHGNTRTRHT